MQKFLFIYNLQNIISKPTIMLPKSEVFENFQKG